MGWVANMNKISIRYRVYYSPNNITHTKRYLSIYIFLLISWLSLAQTNNNEDLFLKQRTIFIYNLIRQTGWDNIDQLKAFNIGVLGDDPITSVLKEMGDQRTVVGLPIRIKKYGSIQQIDNIQLLYVNNKFDYDIDSIRNRITGKNTLLITENYLFNESMINIIATNNIFQFELNEEFLNAEKFIVTPAIRQLAITSSERWREMYEDSEKNLDIERTKVNEQLEILEVHKKAINEQNVELVEQQEAIAKQTSLLEAQNQQLIIQKNKLGVLQSDYHYKTKQLDSLETYLDSQRRSIEHQLISINKQDSILNAQEANINEQLVLINKQGISLAEQQSTIQLQQRFNYLLIALFFLAFIALFVILISYRIKKKTNQKLLQLNKEKNLLIGVVSHDLRSPINQIKGLTNIMLLDNDVKLKDRQKEYLTTIIGSCERQIDMIRRILDINAIESKKINVKITKENLFDITNAVVSNFQLTAANKSIELNIQKPDNTPYAMVDENYLIQVLENIVSNAIKYSEKETKIDVIVGTKNDKVNIAVKDNGPGISKVDQEKMFGHYQQLSAKPTAGEDSYGLGLSIAKKYIEAMGGTITCKSKLGEGAIFELTFEQL